MRIIEKLFMRYGWACFYRRKTTSVLQNNLHTDQPFKQLIASWRYWCADPFIVKEKDKYYVFCELMDIKTSYALLGIAELNPSGKTYVRPIADLKCHVSYPNVFKIKDTWYMIPETSNRKTIELYKAIKFPYEWKKIATLANNINAADTTVFVQDNKYYIFIYEQNYNPDKLSIAHLNLETFKLENICSVMEYYTRVGRPAGNIFVEGDKYYRPVQYGINEYGEKIFVYRFAFDVINKKYKEEKVKELSLADFDEKLEKQGFKCCHTYNSVGDFEVIDTKYAKFSLLKPIYWIMKHFV